MQVAIDNAKRRFDIDLVKEIDDIKADMNIAVNGLPAFWKIIKKDIIKEKNKKKKRKKKENLEAKINYDLKCPMNFIFDIEVDKFRNKESTLPMETFFVKYEMNEHHRKSKKVEEFIQKYSLDLYNYNMCTDDENKENYLLLRSDYDDLVRDIKSIYISNNYLGMMSWLINRAFCIGAGVKSKQKEMQSTINTNKSLLLKVLYDVNKEALLKCFAKNIEKVAMD